MYLFCYYKHLPKANCEHEKTRDPMRMNMRNIFYVGEENRIEIIYF